MTEEEIRAQALWLALSLEKLNRAEMVDAGNIINIATEFEMYIKGE